MSSSTHTYKPSWPEPTRARPLAILAAGLFVMLALATALPRAAFGAAPLALEGARQGYQIDFGKTITFTLETPWNTIVPERATLFFGLPDGPSRNLAYARPRLENGLLEAVHVWEVRDALVPGAELEFQWTIETVGGDELATDPQTLLYQDDSLPWSKVGADRIEIRWYSGGEEFGRRALRAAEGALKRLEQRFGVALERPTRIVLYADGDRMRAALGGGTSPWVAGQAIAPFNVVVLNTPPSTPELDLLIAHELTHIVISQATKNPFGGPPGWIHEGLATFNESTGRPRFDYDAIVARAVRDGSLISLRGLTATFPADNSRAILAYAESNSLMKFVIERFGDDAVSRLLATYREGVTDDEAARLSLGVGLDELESFWRESIGAPAVRSPRSAEAPQPAEPSAAPATPEPTLNADCDCMLPETSAQTGHGGPKREPAAAETAPPAETRGAEPTPVGTKTTDSIAEALGVSPEQLLFARTIVVGSGVVISAVLGFIVWKAARRGKGRGA